MTKKQIDTLQDEADNQIDAPESETIGSLLQQARLAMGASVADVAGQLHLRPCIVTDIEADRFDEIASPTYVKGYVKNFARIVQADQAAIKRCLAIQLPQAVDPQMQSFSRKTTRQARDGRLMFVTYLIGFILLALLVVWWVQKSDLLSSTDISMPTVEEIADSSSSTERQVTAEQETVEQASVALPSVASVFDHEAEANDENLKGDVSQGVSSSNEAALVEPILVETPSAEVTTHVADESTLSALMVDLNGDCWINITDSSGKVLVNDLKRAGSKLNLSGAAPFKLTLGAPQSVNIELDGKAVSLADFPSGRVARLTLPFAG
ncbi:RodZ domain-containing protein [Shewanella sp. UCD-KL12]|uniref:RodZ domain-containing protein n=1 Tax=Shewanella sp. UCD-KL12 TaxID=1917163 RepID=UPI0009713025|nr:RodZ domain-containing protein [Shewanella sp. UCD-KL12]